MKMEDLIFKDIGIIRYYNENKKFPMYENIYEKNVSFIDLINKHFNAFIDNEKISYTKENFKLFEIIFYDTLINIFDKYKRIRIFRRIK